MLFFELPDLVFVLMSLLFVHFLHLNLVLKHLAQFLVLLDLALELGDLLVALADCFRVVSLLLGKLAFKLFDSSTESRVVGVEVLISDSLELPNLISEPGNRLLELFNILKLLLKLAFQLPLLLFSIGPRLLVNLDVSNELCIVLFKSIDLGLESDDFWLVICSDFIADGQNALLQLCLHG